jgi:hypothetical protein
LMKPEGEARSRLSIKWQLWMPTAYDGTLQGWRWPERVDRGYGWRRLVIITLVEARGSGRVCASFSGKVEALGVIAGIGRRLKGMPRPAWPSGCRVWATRFAERAQPGCRDGTAGMEKRKRWALVPSVGEHAGRSLQHDTESRNLS